MIKLVAITGKIGSGKTQVLNIFKDKGYPVLSADKIYHELLKDKEFILQISASLNVPPIMVNGEIELDKKTISSIVFKDENKLKILNKITHPKIMDEMLSRAKKYSGLVFCEVPLLQNSGYENCFNVVIQVIRDNLTSIKSVEIRDGLKEKEVTDRQKYQPEYENKSGITHIIINNDGSLLSLEQKVSAIESKIF